MDQPQTAPVSNSSSSGLIAPGELLSRAWRVFKEHWKTLVAIQAIFLVLAIVLEKILMLFGVVGAGVLGVNIFSDNQTVDVISGSLLAASIIAMIVGALFSLILGGWQQASLILALRDRASHPTALDTWKKSLKKAPAVIGASLLAGILIIAGFLVFFLPGVYLAVIFSFVVYVVVLDNVPVGKALGASRAYVRGRWFAVFFRFFIIGLIVVATYLVVGGLGFLTGSETATSIINLALSLFLTPFTTVYAFLLYENVRATPAPAA